MGKDGELSFRHSIFFGKLENEINHLALLTPSIWSYFSITPLFPPIKEALLSALSKPLLVKHYEKLLPIATPITHLMPVTATIGASQAQGFH